MTEMNKYVIKVLINIQKFFSQTISTNDKIIKSKIKFYKFVLKLT
jgi:hypothetical protein